MAEMRPYCVSCGRKTEFKREPVEVATRIGARRRLAGRCGACGKKVSCFLPSEDGPTAHSVRVGETVWRELRRASSLTETSQRAIIENIVMENLEEFVGNELEELQRGGVITPGERMKRERELGMPIEGWTPPEPKGRKDTDDAPALFRSLKDLLS